MKKNKNASKNKPKLEVTFKPHPEVKGIGLLTRPIHVSDPSDHKLPDRESEYLHPTRPNGRIETKQEALIRRFHRDGLTLERIAVNTGAKLESIFELLGLDKNSQEFKDIQARLDARKRV